MPDQIETTQFNGRTLVYDGLVQTDLDMDNHRLLNLDDSNLTFGSAPPTVGPVAHQWLRSWNSTTRVWGISQPAFGDLSGNLTPAQQTAITQLGTITSGTWHGTTIDANHLPRLSGINPPVGPVSLNSQKIINLAPPTALTDAVNLGYVNAILPGLQIKEAVKCATTANITLYGAPQTIDGFPVGAGQRVLVKNQTNEAHNGIYLAVANNNWNRAHDSDTGAELNQAYCFVLNGTQNAHFSFVQVNTVTSLGTSPVHYVVFSSGTIGPAGPPGPGVPPSGSAHQILEKIDGVNYNTRWVTPAYQPLGSVPVGGTEGQVLLKGAGGDYDTEWGWGLPPGGADNFLLRKDSTSPYGSTWFNIVPLLVPPQELGTPGQFLQNDNGATFGGTWATAREVPPTETTAYTAAIGDILIKDSLNDDGYRWVTSPSQVPPGVLPGQVLTFFGVNDPVAYDNRWATPSPDGAVYAILLGAQQNPTGTTSTDGVMMGLARVITPFVTGKIIVAISGSITNTSTGTASATIAVGDGTPPSNGDAIIGFPVGGAAIRQNVGANVSVPFSLTAALYDLTPGNPIWIDLIVSRTSIGTARVAAVSVSAWEIP